jgi:transposase
VELWAEDEMRVGLKPVLRRVWAPRGRRPVAKTRRRYEWAYVYGFVRPQTGEVFWLVMATVNAQAFSLALSRFAEWVGASEDKRVVLVLDRAGWHVAKDLKVPEGLHLEFLPARSPELQPAKKLWPLANERIANRPFEDLDELEGALVERCLLTLSERPDLLRGHTSYRWWPVAV